MSAIKEIIITDQAPVPSVRILRLSAPVTLFSLPVKFIDPAGQFVPGESWNRLSKSESRPACSLPPGLAGSGGEDDGFLADMDDFRDE
jgi:hypothetical protein